MPVLPSTRPLVLSSLKRNGNDVLNKDPPLAVEGISRKARSCCAGADNAALGMCALGNTQGLHADVKYASPGVTVALSREERICAKLQELPVVRSQAGLSRALFTVPVS